MSTIKSAKRRLLKEIETFCINHQLPIYAEISGQNQTYFISLFERNYRSSFFKPSSPIKKIPITKNELNNLNLEKIRKLVSDIFDDRLISEKFEDHEEEEFHPGFGVKKDER